MAAQIEELLAHQIGVRDHDGVQRARASFALNARRQYVIAFIRIVRRVLIDGHAEHTALHDVSNRTRPESPLVFSRGTNGPRPALQHAAYSSTTSCNPAVMGSFWLNPLPTKTTSLGSDLSCGCGL